MNRVKLIVALIFLVTINVFAQHNPKALQQLKVDVVYLASNLLEGRETGTKGEGMAADYIASRLQEAGATPKGTIGGWMQPFEFEFKSNPHASSGEKRTGKNVIGYIDNKAPTTVIIGAHYDHLGKGIAGLTRHTGEPDFHNGADDNASGVAAMLMLAKQLKQSKLKKNNYLFIAFSGEELGLFGSKYFADNPTIDFTKVNYMINLDMVGRLNEEKVLAINGVGTSPLWNQELPKIAVGGINIKTSESGVGPSDHTSFYLKDVPVLHFFTGQHTDYHKPGDDSELINYDGLYYVSAYIETLISNLNGKGKLPFTKTKDEQQRATSFKVTLGVMPDYVFAGEGMRIDAVLDDRPAQKAGLQKGDILIQIGDTAVKSVYDYMEGLAKFTKGDKTVVKVKRDEKVITAEVEF